MGIGDGIPFSGLATDERQRAGDLIARLSTRATRIGLKLTGGTRDPFTLG
ncbi:MAG: hypothetical protein ABSA03_11480 [Streptosporangiaceae bacterium]